MGNTVDFSRFQASGPSSGSVLISKSIDNAMKAFVDDDNNKQAQIGLQLKLLDTMSSIQNDNARTRIQELNYKRQLAKDKLEEKKYNDTLNRDLKLKKDKLAGISVASDLSDSILSYDPSTVTNAEVEDDTKKIETYDIDNINKELIRKTENGELTGKEIDPLTDEQLKMIADYESLSKIKDPVKQAEKRVELNEIYFGDNPNKTKLDALDPEEIVKDAVTPDSLIGAAGMGAATGGALGLFGGPLAPFTAPVGALWGAGLGSVGYLGKKAYDFVKEYSEDPIEKAKRLAKEEKLKEEKTTHGLSRDEEAKLRIAELKKKRELNKLNKVHNAEISQAVNAIVNNNKTVKNGTKTEKVKIVEKPSVAIPAIENIGRNAIKKILARKDIDIDVKLAAVDEIKKTIQRRTEAYVTNYTEYQKRDAKKNELTLFKIKEKFKNDLEILKKQKEALINQNKPLTKKEKLQMQKLEKEIALKEAQRLKVEKELKK